MVSTKMVQRLTTVIFLFLASIVYGEEYDHYDYWIYTSGEITVGWDPVSNVIEYESRFYNVERKTYVAIGRTSSSQITFKCPRSGHYRAEVKSIGNPNEDGSDNHSEWSDSFNTDRAVVNGQPRSWWIYCRVAPPTDVVIER